MILPGQNNKKENILKEVAKEKNFWKLVVSGFVGLLIFTQLFDVNISVTPRFDSGKNQNNSRLEESVLPLHGIILPIRWGNYGKEMIDAGVIDKDAFESIYAERGGLDEEEKKLLFGEGSGYLTINEKNSGFLLNLFWAFGLANKNHVLEEGPMQDARYGGDASNFASVGGWLLAKGSAMDHYNRHAFVSLTKEQQKIVEKVSQNIYRPCCGNSTYFPDCNHGMAMLGLLELMASQGASEKEMYKVALQINSYWFPDTYLTIAEYFKNRGVRWNNVDPKTVLGSAYSSARGYKKILAEVNPLKTRSGGRCEI